MRGKNVNASVLLMVFNSLSMTRWGDAPVHSIAVAMLLKTSEVHFFNDIGYKHNPLMHCPTDPFLQKNCWCNEKDNFGM